MNIAGRPSDELLPKESRGGIESYNTTAKFKDKQTFPQPASRFDELVTNHSQPMRNFPRPELSHPSRPHGADAIPFQSCRVPLCEIPVLRSEVMQVVVRC